MGYAGGAISEPTYHHLGGHSETIEMDYDPAVLTYEDLLAVFLASHSPTRPAYSTQYRSAVFYRTEEERLNAEDMLARAQATLGPLHTALEPLDRFWRAEDYHQKYRLRSHGKLMAQFREMYATDREIVDSTAAARINGWLDGLGERDHVERELPLTGMSVEGQEEIRAHALPRERARR